MFPRRSSGPETVTVSTFRHHNPRRAALRANASAARLPRAHRRAAFSSRSGQGQPLVEDLAHLLRRDLPEIGTLGEAFADQAIGSLVQAALPGMARGCEAESRLQPGGDLPASGELLAVVRGHGVHPVPVRTQAPRPCWPAALGSCTSTSCPPRTAGL